MDEELKSMIDGMDYEVMLRLWRFSPIGDPLFFGETGQYFSEVMKEKRKKLEEGEESKISKQIGWDK